MIPGLTYHKIFAFYGSDLRGYPDNFLKCLWERQYHFLALDSKAIELASLSEIPYTIINDWLDTPTMLEIQDIAWDCENNWYEDYRESFTTNGVCWPEFDHVAMQCFWLDAIASLKLADIFREKGLAKLLIVRQNNQIPYVFSEGSGACKILWETELPDIVKIIESNNVGEITKITSGHRNTFQSILFTLNDSIRRLKETSSFKNRITMIIKSIRILFFYFISRFEVFSTILFAPTKEMKGKIAFLASPTELTRSHDLLLDLTTSFPKNVVIIPNKISWYGVDQIMNKWAIPVIDLIPKYKENPQLSKKFSDHYRNLMNTSKGKAWDKIVNNLQFHFLFYCQSRWPMLDDLLNNYLKNLSKNPPRIIIGSALNLAEWHLPILAAQRCGITTISIPHGFGISRPTIDFPQTTQELRFDYNLYLDQLSKEILRQIASLDGDKLIPCRNCTDIDSHFTQQIKAEFSQESWKILILFNPTSYTHPGSNNQFIYPLYINPKIQMEAIRILNSPPDDLKEKISIKMKVHPFFSELELFKALGKETINNVLPTDTQLKPVLDETDLVIGVNYFGSALFHALKNNKPVILFVNDEFFEKSNTKAGSLFDLLGNSIRVIRTSGELWDLVRKFFTDPSESAQMKTDVFKFSDEFLNNSNFPIIRTVIEGLLQRDDAT